MITFEALDVILRVQNLPGFIARLRAGARSVKGIGTAAASASQSTSAAIMAAARRSTLSIVALAAVAAATGFKQSVEFEKQLTLVHTQAGATLQEMKRFKQPLLDLAEQTTQGPIELAKGLYHVKSIGIPATQSLEALKVAAEGAMVGNADLEQTTSALGAAWLAGIKGANGFRNTMAIMNATVGAGNMRMDELVTALGTGVLPTAKLAGLGIQDVMAALALLKDEGYGAYGAMAQFATALHFFTSPTKKATDAFKKLGLSQLDLADMMRKRGMVPTLALLRDRLHLTGEEMAKLSKKNWAPETQQEKLLGAILPGGRGRVFRVLLNQVDRYQMKIDQINKTTGRFGEAIRKTQETSAARIHIAWSSVQVALVRLGDAFRGTGTDAVVFAINALAKFINTLAKIPDFVKRMKNAWDSVPGIIKLVVFWVAIFIAQLLVIRGLTIVIMVMRAAWAALTLAILAARGALWLLFIGGGPIGWLLLGISLLLTVLIMHWGWFKQAAIDAFHWTKTAAENVFGWLKDHWRQILHILFGPFGGAVTMIVDRWRQLLDFFRRVVSFMKRVAHAIYKPFEVAINAAGAAMNLVSGKGSQHSNPLSTSTPRFSGGSTFGSTPGGYTGGLVYAGGYMDVGEHGKERIYLPAGSRIQPAGFRSTPGGRAGGSGREIIELHNHTYLDGKEISENVSHHMANKKARK